MQVVEFLLPFRKRQCAAMYAPLCVTTFDLDDGHFPLRYDEAVGTLGIIRFRKSNEPVAEGCLQDVQHIILEHLPPTPFKRCGVQPGKRHIDAPPPTGGQTARGYHVQELLRRKAISQVQPSHSESAIKALSAGLRLALPQVPQGSR